MYIYILCILLFLVTDQMNWLCASAFLPVLPMSRDTATATEAAEAAHEQKLFDPSSLKLGAQDAESSAISTVSSAHAHIHEGYGFRPSSGAGTPKIDGTSERPVKSPIPDAYGLGWPGLSSSSLSKQS